MIRTRTIALTAAVLAVILGVPSGYGAGDIDRTAVDFKTPAEIKWVKNAAGTNESAVLFGDPSKPGPYVVRVKWLPGNMSRPHFHPNDRFFAVLSGTWWMGTGEKFDPESTVPAPVGSYVIHYGGKVHYDGAKNEETIIQVWGMGPATSTPAERSRSELGSYFAGTGSARHILRSPVSTLSATTEAHIRNTQATANAAP